MVTTTKPTNRMAKKDSKRKSKAAKDNAKALPSVFEDNPDLKNTVAQIEQAFGDGAIMPLGAVVAISAIGWRETYVACAILAALVMLPLIAWLLHGGVENRLFDPRSGKSRSATSRLRRSMPATCWRPRSWCARSWYVPRTSSCRRSSRLASAMSPLRSSWR